MRKKEFRMSGYKGQYIITPVEMSLYKFYLLVKNGLTKKEFAKGDIKHVDYKKFIKENKGFLPFFNLSMFNYKDENKNKMFKFNGQIVITIKVANKVEYNRIKEEIIKLRYVTMCFKTIDGNLRVIVNVRPSIKSGDDYNILLLRFRNIYNTWVFFISNFIGNKYKVIIEKCNDITLDTKTEYSYDRDVYYNEDVEEFDFKYMTGGDVLTKILYEFIIEADEKPLFKGFRHKRISSKVMSLHLHYGYKIEDLNKFIDLCCNELGKNDIKQMVDGSIEKGKEKKIMDLLTSLSTEEFFRATMEGDQLREALEGLDACKNFGKKDKDIEPSENKSDDEVNNDLKDDKSA